MENPDKSKIEQIIRTRKKAHTWYTTKSIVYRSFVEMELKGKSRLTNTG